LFSLTSDRNTANLRERPKERIRRLLYCPKNNVKWCAMETFLLLYSNQNHIYLSHALNKKCVDLSMKCLLTSP
jgi:hypothetical protein